MANPSYSLARLIVKAAIARPKSPVGLWFRELDSDQPRLAEVYVDQGRPISYMALEVGTPVLSSSGTEFGEVEHVLQIPELDLFDGIAVKSHHHGLRFVDRDQIEEITTTGVRCSLTDDEVETLPAPKGALVLHPDTAHDEGPSLTARWGRLFGREHWKELE